MTRITAIDENKKIKGKSCCHQTNYKIGQIQLWWKKQVSWYLGYTLQFSSLNKHKNHPGNVWEICFKPALGHIILWVFLGKHWIECIRWDGHSWPQETRGPECKERESQSREEGLHTIKSFLHLAFFGLRLTNYVTRMIVNAKELNLGNPVIPKDTRVDRELLWYGGKCLLMRAQRQSLHPQSSHLLPPPPFLGGWEVKHVFATGSQSYWTSRMSLAARWGLLGSSLK